MKHSKWGLRLIHDVTTSDRSGPTPKFLNIDPSRLRGGIRLRVVPYTHSQLIKVQKHFVYMKWICEALQVGFEAQPYTHSQLIKVQKLYIYMIWICEALQVGFEAHP